MIYYYYMNYPTIFHLISDTSKKTGARCVLIGGFAVNFYKVTRQTADVDFLITKEDFGKIMPLLKKAGCKQDFSQKAFASLTSTGKTYLIDADFMFVDKDTMDKVIENGKKTKIAGQKFMVPSLNDLIALKLHSIKYNPGLRENRDLPDIIELIRANKLNFKSDSFRKLCLKYGTQDIYDTILARI